MCVFCEIINGNIPSTKVYEDDSFVAFLDINGLTKGHTLVVPKKHCETLLELDENYTSKALLVCKKVAMILLEKYPDSKGFNIVNNNGSCAGQTVNHFHIHVILRYDNDNIKIL